MLLSLLYLQNLTNLQRTRRRMNISKKYAGEWVKRFLDSNAAGWREHGIAVIKKYVEELCGAGAAKVYTKATQIELDTKSGGLIININLWDDPKDTKNSVIVSLDVLKIKDKLYNYIFNSLFRSFPFASTLLAPPSDPLFIINK